MEQFFVEALPLLEVVSIPAGEIDDEAKIRGINDRPILRAAIKARANILLNSDNDFLESAVSNIKIMKAAQFIKSY